MYRTTIRTPHACEVSIQGARSFRCTHTRLSERVEFRGQLSEFGWIGLGPCLEFQAGDQWIITSHVRAIAVEPSTTWSDVFSADGSTIVIVAVVVDVSVTGWRAESAVAAIPTRCSPSAWQKAA